ncbi:MAG: phage tail protein [Vallitalea sp.]|jgi:phage protein U|nr:phage tail protein [Vallitalea sp.]
MIGYFGDIFFSTSDKKILNFVELKRDAANRIGYHEVIGTKPYSEFIGPSLDVITFSINLNANHGVKPKEEMDKWLNYSRQGNAFMFVLGNKPLGVDKWIVTGVSQAYNTIFNNGELFSGKVDITLEEYVEEA